jgi:hypothetical protein
MMISTETLLRDVMYGVPSGNYDGSSLDWVSDSVKGSDYYQGRGGVQTIAVDVEGFLGSIVVEATLDSDPNSAGWFSTINFTDATVQRSQSVMGNFTWIRARIRNFTAGTINLLKVNY